jgi:DNA-binding XRE family transcriptional regulator
MDIDVPNFSGRLRAAREAAGYPTGAAAIKAIGIDVNTYYHAECGRRPNPPWNTVYRIVVGAGLGLEHFWPEEMIEAAARRIDAARKGRRIR